MPFRVGGGGLTLSEVAAGSVVADGTEQQLFAPEGLSKFYGLVDLANLSSADSVQITIYGRITSGGAWRRYWRETYTGIQTDPLLHLVPKTLRYGFRVTLRQTAGSYRSFAYAGYKEG